MSPAKAKIRKPFEGVIPALRRDLRERAEYIRDNVRNLDNEYAPINDSRTDFVTRLKAKIKEEREHNAWVNRGQDSFFSQYGRYSGRYILDFAIKVMKLKAKKNKPLVILELGMGEGRHVQDMIDSLNESVPEGKIEYHDLSLTKAYSNSNPQIIHLEKEGILKRHVGAFEIISPAQFPKADLVISRWGPLSHGIKEEYKEGGFIKLLKMTNIGGKIFLNEISAHDFILLHKLKSQGKIEFISPGFDKLEITRLK